MKVDDPFGPRAEPAMTAAPSRNGHSYRPAPPGVRICPSCGAAGVRFIRSTGRWYRAPTGENSFGYVTFCAACGHEHGETAAE
jgi:hypothetical protein